MASQQGWNALGHLCGFGLPPGQVLPTPPPVEIPQVPIHCVPAGVPAPGSVTRTAGVQKQPLLNDWGFTWTRRLAPPPRHLRGIHSRDAVRG